MPQTKVYHSTNLAGEIQELTYMKGCYREAFSGPGIVIFVKSLADHLVMPQDVFLRLSQLIQEVTSGQGEGEAVGVPAPTNTGVRTSRCVCG